MHCSVDTEIEVTRDANTGISTATVTKQRDVKTEGSVSLRLRRVQLGIDDDGEPVTSCVVERAEPQPRPAKKLTGAAKIAFDQLCNCLADHAQEIAPSRHVPTGVQGVTLELWRGYLENAGIVNRKGSPREQFRRVRVTLQDLGFIGVRMGVTSRHIGVTVTETAQGVTRHIPIRGCDGCDGLPEWAGLRRKRDRGTG